MTNKITYSQMRIYAETNGFLTVWKSWRDNMLRQGRDVPEKRMRQDTLPQNDIELDTEIAYDVVMDFVSWLNCEICNPGENNDA